jgi:hypothetical protein
MTTSLAVTSLAQLPPAELAADREKKRADLARLTVEVEQVEAALAIQARAAKPHKTRSGRQSKPGSSRKRVLDIVGSSDGPVSPAQIKHAMAEHGKTLSGGGLYQLIKRLVDDGELHKIANGAYTLPAHNGADPSGPTENGDRPTVYRAIAPE